MEVARVGEVVEVEIIPAEFGDSAGISENVAPAGAGQDHGESGLGCVANHAHMRDIDPGLAQAVESDVAEIVIADARLEADAAAEGSQVVSHDGGRGAKREGHAVGEQFALGSKLVGETVEDQVEVEFSGDGDVETGHGKLVASDTSGAKALTSG